MAPHAHTPFSLTPALDPNGTVILTEDVLQAAENRQHEAETNLEELAAKGRSERAGVWMSYYSEDVRVLAREVRRLRVLVGQGERKLAWVETVYPGLVGREEARTT